MVGDFVICWSVGVSLCKDRSFVCTCYTFPVAKQNIAGIVDRSCVVLKSKKNSIRYQAN